MTTKLTKSNFTGTSKLLLEDEIIDFLKKSLECNNDDKEKILNYIEKLFNKEFNENTQEQLLKFVYLLQVRRIFKPFYLIAT
jgi:hypothetical protein